MSFDLQIIKLLLTRSWKISKTFLHTQSCGQWPVTLWNAGHSEVFLIPNKDTSNIINRIGCSFFSHRPPWQVDSVKARQGNHSFSCLLIQFFSGSRLRSTVSRQPTLWYNRRDLSLSQASGQTVDSFSECWPTFTIYVNNHCRPYIRNFLPFLVKKQPCGLWLFVYEGKYVQQQRVIYLGVF